jgi:hypothetical protein
MKQHRPSLFSDVVPAGPGHRTPQTMLLINERDRYLREAAIFFPACRDREIARRLHKALLTYRNGRWRRDGIETTCPPQHRGKLVQMMWMIFKVRDRLPSEMTIRRALGYS